MPFPTAWITNVYDSPSCQHQPGAFQVTVFASGLLRKLFLPEVNSILQNFWALFPRAIMSNTCFIMIPTPKILTMTFTKSNYWKYRFCRCCSQVTSLSSLAWSKAEFTMTAVTKFIKDTLGGLDDSHHTVLVLPFCFAKARHDQNHCHEVCNPHGKLGFFVAVMSILLHHCNFTSFHFLFNFQTYTGRNRLPTTHKYDLQPLNITKPKGKHVIFPSSQRCALFPAASCQAARLDCGRWEADRFRQMSPG